jgi:hypothetical protein
VFDDWSGYWARSTSDHRPNERHIWQQKVQGHLSINHQGLWVSNLNALFILITWRDIDANASCCPPSDNGVLYSVGITLTGADRVIMFDPSWSPAEDR